ncbi:MAG: indole-3-glycerol phosphate synthase TrpC [Gammaproteobacteria bacterium]|nr:indole-3-glycerol phosphate synthase TrpC [Gammaproteobacteria bacterium]
MTARGHLRVAAAREHTTDAAVTARARAQTPAAPLRLSPEGFDLIAEVKRRSPALGQLADAALDPVGQAGSYAAAGAAALSVLTEPEEFHGDIADLENVAAEIPAVPAMRKDFLVDPYQVWEARAAGAGGVLLVAACLDRPVLAEMLDLTLDLGMFALVEVFDDRDLAHCLPIVEAAGSPVEPGAARILLGVNCRDLRSLEVDFGRFAGIANQLPESVPKVAESGVATPADAAAVAGLGYDLALVGTALMRAGDPRTAAGQLLAAARDARQ